MLCGLLSGEIRLLSAGNFQLYDLAILQIAQPQPARRGDNDIEYRPAQTEATRLTWKASDDLRAPADLFE
jgi:hypothetical protein